jgi:crotonobetainyl-CoA:carnitine CoA-transferase CaiB-like acyl-CoA transferase
VIVHNCFRCVGDDVWCTIVVRTSEEWAALYTATDGAVPEDPLPVGRSELEAAIEAWTRTLDARTIMDRLQYAGVEAARVQTARDLVEDDEQLRARGYYAWYDHILSEKAMVDGIPYKMSLTPGAIRSGGPAYGIHNEYVFGELLGLAPSRINQLNESGVIA